MSHQSISKSISIHFAVSAPEGKWWWEEILTESKKGSGPSFCTKHSHQPAHCCASRPLPFPPLCPFRAQTAFQFEVVWLSCLFLVSSAFQQQRSHHSCITSCRSLPALCKAAAKSEMVCRQCQQEEEELWERAGEGCEVLWALSGTDGVRRSWAAGWCLVLHQPEPGLLAKGSVQLHPYCWGTSSTFTQVFFCTSMCFNHRIIASFEFKRTLKGHLV